VAENDTVDGLEKTVLSQTVPTAQGTPEDYFPESKVPANTFEIGLVLGGTGSTGPYTAGVLDFLIHALDEWDKAREAERDLPAELQTVPQHHIRLRIITGTSGGGICSLLTARALHYRFPAAVDGSPKKTLSANPYYDIWVNNININHLLQSSDLEGYPIPPIQALLNGEILKTIAGEGLRYPSPQQQRSGKVTVATGRTYLANPLPVVVTHTNLAGIPIYFDYPGPRNTQAPLVPDGVAVYTGTPESGPLEISASAGTPVLKSAPWESLAQYALGTSAFPVGLPARTVQRDGSHYAYRFTWDTDKEMYAWLVPQWNRFAPTTGLNNYSFISLDGGCTDNEPIALATQTLEGLGYSQRKGHVGAASEPSQPLVMPTDTGRHRLKPWDKRQANRPVLLVDPLCDIPSAASSRCSSRPTGLQRPTCPTSSIRPSTTAF
jgi:hypothetical protein